MQQELCLLHPVNRGHSNCLLDARINFPALLPRDIREISPNLPCTSYANAGLSIGRQIQGKCQATVRLELGL